MFKKSSHSILNSCLVFRVFGFYLNSIVRPHCNPRLLLTLTEQHAEWCSFMWDSWRRKFCFMCLWFFYLAETRVSSWCHITIIVREWRIWSELGPTGWCHSPFETLIKLSSHQNRSSMPILLNDNVLPDEKCVICLWLSIMNLIG